MAKFVEGEMIPSWDRPNVWHVFNISLAEYSLMSVRVWADHKRMTKAARRQMYSTTRRQQGRTFQFRWAPEWQAFQVKEITK